MRTHLVPLSLAMLAVVTIAAGCSKTSESRAAQPAPAALPPVTAAIPTADQPPMALLQLGQSASALFDAADAADWDAATDETRGMREFAVALPGTLSPPDVAQQLRSRIRDAEKSAHAHRRVKTMDYANGVTHLVAELAGQFHTRVPYDAILLGYYGRQLELGIASSAPSTLIRARTDLKSTWNSFEPVIEQRGKLDDARRFTDIVVALDGARHPADFVAPTRAALTEADRIEHLF
jgi:hypothetical protein